MFIKELILKIINYILISEVNVKSKWKYLRDNFRKELAKQPKCQSGLGADMTNIRSSWPYFTSLLFLKDQFGLKKPPSSNAEYNPVDEDVSEMLEVSYDDPDMQQGNALLPLPSPSGSYYGESSNDEPCASKNPFKRRKTNMPELSEDFLNGEKQKFKEPKEKCSKKSEEESNEDLKFFESLLPHVKKISSHQKLLLRSRMLDLVQQYAYNSAQSSGFQSPRSNPSPQTTVNQD